MEIWINIQHCIDCYHFRSWVSISGVWKAAIFTAN